jgi:7,8-dihydropterin-6-yl-methyl-4-(beta-D-ribofuranosyl)aminobenzene 5'-phosphate synthase
MEQEGHTEQSHPLDALTITVVHDNYPFVEGLTTAWGFSAHIAGARKNILFDTGSDGPLLLENLAKLRIDPAGIDALVLSHAHGDHAGGLTGLLEVNPRVEVYLPESFPARIKDLVRGYGAPVVEAGGPRQICEGVYTTGVLGRRIKEQALAVRTSRGLIVLTGCAHPGVVSMVDGARRLGGEDLLLVMGGFHLEWAMSGKVERIIAAFRAQGVRYVAPTHCSGEKARERFKQHFGRGFVEVGVGKIVTLADLV